MTDTPTFIMLGHGGDRMAGFHGERKIMKKGYTLVTITECGTEVTTPKLGQMLAVLERNKSLARDPAKNQDKLQDKLNFQIRIYSEGNEYPSLVYQPASFFEIGNNTLYARSGVLNLNDLTKEDAQITYQLPSSRGKTEEEVIAQTYSKSVFPLDIKKMEDGKKKYTIEYVFRELGPGVYYFPICRSPFTKDPPRSGDVQLMKNKSEAQQQERKKSSKSSSTSTEGMGSSTSTSTEGMGGNSSKSTKGGRGKRMKKRLTRRRKYGTRRTTMRLV